MIARLVNSLQHPLVKKLVKLRESRAYRQQEKTTLLVGETVIREVAAERQIKTLISTAPLSLPSQTSVLATPAVIQKIIGHKTEDCVVAEVYFPPPSTLNNHKLVVLLDGISDPGNVGTIFRTTLALGWDSLFVIEGSADPYNDKSLRASRGAPLLLPWIEGSWDEAELFLKAYPRDIVYADTQGTALSKMKFFPPLLLVLGHETRGPSKRARTLGKAVTIPMKGKMESLNVASAASILLYHIQEVLS